MYITKSQLGYNGVEGSGMKSIWSQAEKTRCASPETNNEAIVAHKSSWLMRDIQLERKNGRQGPKKNTIISQRSSSFRTTGLIRVCKLDNFKEFEEGKNNPFPREPFKYLILKWQPEISVQDDSSTSGYNQDRTSNSSEYADPSQSPSSPYYLHPGENPRSILVPPPLDGDNYYN
ncbi:hypothetical protein CR513_29884, partial [Mucuna pruriens]